MKKQAIFLIFYLLFVISLPLLSQETSTDTIIHKARPPKSVEYGLNMTAMILEFVPLLNRTTARTGPYTFSYKRFRGEHGFRMGLGAHIDPNEPFNISEPLNNINIRIGHERRKEISPRWRYSRGMDFVAFVGSLNSPIGNIGPSLDEGGGGVGLGFTLGAEYLILPNLSISTEGMLFAGGSNRGFIINFIPPVSIFLNAKFK